jgi:hypothetical protein
MKKYSQSTETREITRRLSCFNATSFLETTFTLVFSSIPIYLLVTIAKNYHNDFDSLVVMILSAICMGLVIVWFFVMQCDYRRYVVGHPQFAKGEHYNSIIVHLIYSAVASGCMLTLSVTYYGRFVINTNQLEKETGIMVQTLIYGVAIAWLPMEISTYACNFMLHRSPMPIKELMSIK